MKIIFTNPPFIHSKDSDAKNEFNIKGWKFNKLYRKNQYLFKIWTLLRDRSTRYGVRAGSRWPWTSDMPIEPLHFPFIMAYACSLAKQKGFEAMLIDAIAEENYSYKKYLSQIKRENPSIVIIETSAPSFKIDVWLAKKISSFTEVALAGPHITSMAKAVQKNYPYIKYLLKGEYILSSLKMIRTQKPGIYESEIVRNLDEIPYPDRDFKNAQDYFDFTMPTKKPQLQIYASKGCPFKCSFCVWPQLMYMRKNSYRNPKKIVKEIKYAIKKYNYKSIFFDDDTFNIGVDRISNLCDELKKIGIPWSMMGRLDTSPLWLFDKMIDSGCVGMRFGVETFNLKILKNINKGLEAKDFKKTIKYLANKYPKLMIRIFMMKDLPGQTNKIHKKDIKILNNFGFKKSGNIYRQIQISKTTCFPGTKLYKNIKHKQ